jgi:catalase (peroxidase I)
MIRLDSLIVVGGCSAIEEQRKVGHTVAVPLKRGGLMHHKNRRMQNHLMCTEPEADGFVIFKIIYYCSEKC